MMPLSIHASHVAMPMGPSGRTFGTPLGEDDTTTLLDGCRLLIVEDETMLAMELEFAFQDAGAEVIGPATSLRDGLALAGDRSIAIDAAILDVDLRGQDVFPIAQRLRERGVPFLFHTGHATRQDLEGRFPGAPVCVKPTMTEDLIAVLARLID